MNPETAMQTEANVEQLAAKRRFQPYPSYHDSGAERFGELPQHWNVTSIKRLARKGYRTFTDGDWIESPFIKDEGVRLIQTGNVGIGVYREQGFRYISQETFKAFRCTEVRPKDVLVCRLAEPVGRACLAPDLGVRMITSVDVCILKTRDGIDARYVVYALSSPQYLSWVDSLCRGGTRDRISRSMLGSLHIRLPPLPEQQAIAAFLDRETARIDGLIARKQRLIELLAEKRTALISHAVTKGLNPDATMKDSGISWVGVVPSHWTILPLKFVAMLQTGLTLGKKFDGSQSLVSRPYLRVANVQDGYLDLEHVTQVELPPSDVSRYELRVGDMLMTEGGDFDKLGRGYVWDGQVEGCLHQNHIFALRPDARRLNSRFLACLTSSWHGKAYFTSTSSQTTNLASTNSTKLKSFPVLLPPVREQETILAHIMQTTERYDRLMEATQTGIDRLREYRSALISAAVTGKIDVRREA